MYKAARRHYRHIEVHPIAGALGAEIRGVDITRPLESEVVAEIRQAFLDHLVIILRSQQLAPQELLAFAQRFGEPIEYPPVNDYHGFWRVMHRVTLAGDTPY